MVNVPKDNSAFAMMHGPRKPAVIHDVFSLSLEYYKNIKNKRRKLINKLHYPVLSFCK